LPKTARTRHPAAEQDNVYETRIYIDEKAEEKRRENKERAKIKQEAADPDVEDEPVEMLEIKDRGTGDVMYAGPADAEWKKDDLGDPITYAERFGLETRLSKAKAANPSTKAQGKGETAEGEDVDLNNYTAAEIKAALDKAGVDYPTSASKSALVQLATDNDVSVD
jgi:hypothetical protein